MPSPRFLHALLGIGLICHSGYLLGSADVTAHAKKSSKASAKTLDKDWADHQEHFTTLLNKVQTRKLFTPEDGENFEALLLASQGLQEKYAKVSEFAPTLYNLGILFKAREHYFEAYDAFQTVMDNYPDSPYSRKAKFQMATLKKHMGDDFDMLTVGAPEVAPAKEKTDAKTTAPEKKK
jgi:TolA-binding protein